MKARAYSSRKVKKRKKDFYALKDLKRLACYFYI